MVPPPRANQTLYRGVLAANAAWRPEVVRKPPDPARRRPPKLARPGKLAVVTERPGWAELLERVFGVDAYACPACGKPMRVRTVILEPRLATELLGALERSTGPP